MRKFHNLAVAGAALCALALGGVAYAQSGHHVMRVALPDGGEAIIHYSGEAPEVTINAGPDAPWADSFWREPLGWRGADVEAMFAHMDRQFTAMRATLERLSSAPDTPTAIASAPGARWCAESVTVTQEAGRKPHVERRVSGSCAPAHSSAAAPGREQAHT